MIKISYLLIYQPWHIFISVFKIKVENIMQLKIGINHRSLKVQYCKYLHFLTRKSRNHFSYCTVKAIEIFNGTLIEYMGYSNVLFLCVIFLGPNSCNSFQNCLQNQSSGKKNHSKRTKNNELKCSKNGTRLQHTCSTRHPLLRFRSTKIQYDELREN